MGGYHAGLLGQAYREYGGLPANIVGEIGIWGAGDRLLIRDNSCTSRQTLTIILGPTFPFISPLNSY